MELCEDLRPLLERKSTRMRRPISDETEMAVTLYYLADEGRYMKVANTFGISRSYVSIIIKRVCAGISEYPGPIYVRLPDSEREVQELVNQFHVYRGFPQCAGAVDGTYTAIKEPTEMLLTTSTERDTHLLVFKPPVTAITDSLMWLWNGPAVCLMREYLRTQLWISS